MAHIYGIGAGYKNVEQTFTVRSTSLIHRLLTPHSAAVFCLLSFFPIFFHLVQLFIYILQVGVQFDIVVIRKPMLNNNAGIGSLSYIQCI